MFGDEGLAGFYKLNFEIVTSFHYSLNEIYEMLPFEREVFISLIIQKLQKEKNNN